MIYLAGRKVDHKSREAGRRIAASTGQAVLASAGAGGLKRKRGPKSPEILEFCFRKGEECSFAK